MHVHMRGSIKGSTPNFAIENEAMLPLYLANGITGVRDMGGDLVDLVLQLRSEVEGGKRFAPRIVTCGPKLDGAKPRFPGSIAMTTPEEARTAVQQVKAMGVDFVKDLDSSPDIPHDAKTLDALGPQHGYGIARRIEQISGDLLAVNQGTLYPVLLKLEQEGAIASEWGASENNRRARFYRLTREERKQLQVETQDWEQTAAIIGRFFEAKAEDLPSTRRQGGHKTSD